MKYIWIHFALLICFQNFVAAPFAVSAEKANLESCLFDQLFHNLTEVQTVTSLRRELKTVVNVYQADKLIRYVTSRLGAARVSLRDTPANPSWVAITNTDYIPAFRGWDKRDSVFSGVIRIRNYVEVPKNTPVKNLDRVKAPSYAKLADGDPGVVYAKLEFKVGHPDLNAQGFLHDLDGVVDKPGIVMPRSDIELLLASPESYKANQASITQRALELKLTLPDGSTRAVNSSSEVKEMIKRIGRMHQAGLTEFLANPELNIRYKRLARKLDFTVDSKLLPPELRKVIPAKFELQLTVDRDIQIRDLNTHKVAHYDARDRVVELKIPLSIANLLATKTSAEIRAMGLGDLADVYNYYLHMPLVQGFKRNSGKRAKGVDLLESEIYDRWIGI